MHHSSEATLFMALQIWHVLDDVSYAMHIGINQCQPASGSSTLADRGSMVSGVDPEGRPHDTFQEQLSAANGLLPDRPYEVVLRTLGPIYWHRSCTRSEKAPVLSSCAKLIKVRQASLPSLHMIFLTCMVMRHSAFRHHAGCSCCTCVHDLFFLAMGCCCSVLTSIYFSTAAWLIPEVQHPTNELRPLSSQVIAHAPVALEVEEQGPVVLL